MGFLVIYSLKVAGLTAVFYVLWLILLKKDTLHRLNRAILVMIPALSMILPHCVITIHKTVPGPMPEAGTATGALEEAAKSGMETGMIVWIIYLAGLVLVLMRIAWSALRLSSLIKGGEKHILEDGSTLIITEKSLPPFSWMGRIFMSRQDYEAGSQEIILHEQAHIRLHHSIDIVLTEFLTAFQWYNPMAWMLGADLRGIHEYEADDSVIREGADPTEYQLFLLKRAAMASGLSLVSGLKSGTVKGRIEMMLKRHTGWKAGLKALYIIPVIVLTLIACSKKVTEYDSHEDLVPFQLLDEAERIPFQLVDEKPSFMGGDANEFGRWVNAHLIYPKEARDLSIQGRVTMNFTVTKAGKVKEVKVIRGVHETLDNEAVRVISASPDWTPGRQKGKPVEVTYTFPVTFILR